ncbi:hypothetical protein [Frigoriglobus tundricola]|uniref:SGNH/GDSL hydrolase family protein n=1 Tax=Frigoriglobus tundricola TaxID=2774151 RepID=A0A6M5YN66_9BACT|nr:hypothetical protein [Frigoriglobus tundricola]QJW95358.1 hypothetical protein FTUN_2906 [Frigoriglobus tundricola]
MTERTTARTLPQFARRLVSVRLKRPVVVRAPTRTPQRRTATRRAAQALGAGLVVFALLQIGLAVAARSALISDPFYGDKERLLRRVERAGAPGAVKVLALGSSRTEHGFAAGNVEHAAGAAGRPATAFNFGTSAAGPVTNDVYLRRLLADGHAPALLLLEVLPVLMADTGAEPPETRTLAADRLSWAETDRLVGRYEFPAQFRADRAAADGLPWQSHRFKLLGRVAPKTLPYQLRFNTSRMTDAHGWLPPAGGPGPDPQAGARTVAAYRDTLRDWRPGAAPAAALRDTLALCRAEHIDVALVLMPEASMFRALSPPVVQRRLSEFLAGTSAAFGCRLIDARDWVPDDGFLDGHHLLRPGAVVFTDRLTAEVIVPYLRDRSAGVKP